MMRSFALLLYPLAISAPSAAQQAAADSARVYDLAEVEVLPRASNAADFSAALEQGYPPHLRDAGVGGTVQVAFVLDADGAPREVQVVSASDSGFAAPSVAAVSVLRFSPAQLGGRAVPVRVVQPITWQAPEPAPVTAAAPPKTVGELVRRMGARDQEVHDGAPDSSGAYELGEVDEMPRVRNRDDFARAMQREAQALAPGARAGTVQVRFRVEADGTTSRPSATHSSNELLNAPSLRAVGVLRFHPARLAGRPVPVWVEQPLTWRGSQGRSGGGAPPDTAFGYELSDVEQMPRVLNAHDFSRALMRVYPPQRRDAVRGGMVVVRFRIETDGTISNPHVTYASDPAFAAPTLEAVQVLRFRPARVNGVPVKTWVEQPVSWAVDGRVAPQAWEERHRRRPRLGDAFEGPFYAPQGPCYNRAC